MIPIVARPRPQSDRERQTNRLLAVSLSVTGSILGLLQAHSIAKITFAYIAAYSYAIAFLIAGLLSAIGLFLLTYWRTRWVGIGLISAGILSLACFLGGLAGLSKLDRVSWRHEPPLRSFGPAHKASVVIYFCPGITNQQIEDFRESVLEVPEPVRADRTFPAYVSSYFRLAPSQANGYRGVALNFDKNAAPDQIKNYLAKVDSDRRVMTVYIDAVPSLIQIDRISNAGGRCR